MSNAKRYVFPVARTQTCIRRTHAPYTHVHACMHGSSAGALHIELFSFALFFTQYRLIDELQEANAQNEKKEAAARRKKARERKSKFRSNTRTYTVKSEGPSAEVGELRKQLVELTHNMSTQRAVQDALDKQTKAHERQLTVGRLACNCLCTWRWLVHVPRARLQLEV